MEEVAKSENHLQSAAAFVEGGIQEACDDACSICLEEFCENDPSTVTGCKHEFHLQCILEWCQRSSQCPMCWQSISLKDPLSQELLDAIEQEKNIRMNPPRNTTIFHHPTLGDFELQHLPGSATDAELEERIIQHLAAAAAMGRARQIARREGQRSRSSAHGRPHYLVFSPNATAPNASPMSSSPYHGGEGEADPVTGSNPHFLTVGDDPAQQALPHATQADHFPASASGSSVLPAVNNGSSPNNQRSPIQVSPTSQDRAGPSEFQSFSESLKSRFNSMSMRYKESITKSTRGWKERLFARNNNVSDLSSDVRREGNEGIASVSSMMERLEARDDDTTNRASISSSPRDNTAPNPGNQQICEAGGSNTLHEGNVQSSHAAGSA